MSTRYKACAVPGCDGNADTYARGARGWCRKHYTRWRLHGDPEAGRTPPLEPLDWLHRHADYAENNCLKWPYHTVADGRGMVTVDGRLHPASRVMCEIINGPPPTEDHQAAHTCGKGNEGCVNPRHLVWKTPKENQADRERHGTLVKGERHPSAKLTQQDVRRIRSLEKLESLASLARRFGVCESQIRKIHRRQNWGWVDTDDGGVDASHQDI